MYHYVKWVNSPLHGRPANNLSLGIWLPPSSSVLKKILQWRRRVKMSHFAGIKSKFGLQKYFISLLWTQGEIKYQKNIWSRVAKQILYSIQSWLPAHVYKLSDNFIYLKCRKVGKILPWSVLNTSIIS